MKYENWGNEKLAQLAYGGDALAVEELEHRGNEVDVERKVLRKRFAGDKILPVGRFKAEDTVIVENGSVVGTVEEIDRLGWLVAQAATKAVEAAMAEAALKLELEARGEVDLRESTAAPETS